MSWVVGHDGTEACRHQHESMWAHVVSIWAELHVWWFFNLVLSCKECIECVNRGFKLKAMGSMHSPVHHCVCGKVLVKQCLHMTPISEMRRTWNALLHATGFDLNAHADMKEHEVTGNEIKQWKCPQKIESELVSSTPTLFGHGKANLWRRRRRRSSGCHGGHGSTRVVASMVKNIQCWFAWVSWSRYKDG